MQAVLGSAVRLGLDHESLGDAQDGGTAVFGKLAQKAEAFEEVGRVGDDALGRFAVVAFGEEAQKSLEGDGVGVGGEGPAMVVAGGVPPGADLATGDAAGVGPRGVGQGRLATGAIDDPLQPLLGIVQGLQGRHDALAAREGVLGVRRKVHGDGRGWAAKRPGSWAGPDGEKGAPEGAARITWP